MKHILPAPHRRLLILAEAADYCGMGVEAFKSCPVRPKRIRLWQKGLRWDINQLNEWIDNLPCDGD